MVILTVKEVVVIIIAMILIITLVIIIAMIRHTVEKVSPSNQDSFAGNWKNFGLNESRFLQLSPI